MEATGCGGGRGTFNTVIERIVGGVTATCVDSTPLANFNPSVAFTWTGEELTTIAKTAGGITYTKTITWTGGKITAMSVWS